LIQIIIFRAALVIISLYLSFRTIVGSSVQTGCWYHQLCQAVVNPLNPVGRKSVLSEKLIYPHGR